MFAGFQILIEDQDTLEIIDNMFVEQKILGLAIAHMVESLQTINPKREFHVKVKWRQLSRRPASMIDEGTVEDLPASPLVKIGHVLEHVASLEKKNNMRRVDPLLSLTAKREVTT